MMNDIIIMKNNEYNNIIYPMEFRYLQEEDYNKNYLDLLEQLTEVNKDQITYQRFSNFIKNLDKNHKIVVMEQNNKIVATGTILIEDKLIHGINKVAHIEDIVICNTMRGLGLGKQIIQFLINIAEEDCYKIILNCKEEYIGFYEKCGLVNHAIEMVKYITRLEI